MLASSAKQMAVSNEVKIMKVEYTHTDTMAQPGELERLSCAANTLQMTTQASTAPANANAVAGQNRRSDRFTILELARELGLDRDFDAKRTEGDDGNRGGLQIAHLTEGTRRKTLDGDEHAECIQHPRDQRQAQIGCCSSALSLTARAGF